MCKLKILLFLFVFAINVPFGIASYCPTAPTIGENKDMVCGIEITSIDNIVCVNDDIITFTIFANYTDVGSQGFTITDNQGGVSTHAYSELPLDYEMIGNISSTQELSFTICDIQNPTCCGFYEFANPCFPCNLTGLEVTATCQPGSNLFDLSLYFFETNASTKFYTYINGQQYGPFFYSQLPITISNVVSDCNAEYIVRVEDFVETTCSQQTTLEEICCVPCQITSLMASSVICEQGDIVEITFDLNYEGNGGENFTVVDNLGNVYVFAYADLPVTVSLPAGNVAQNLGFQVCDQALLGCCLYYEFANPCYNPPVCGISNIVVAPTCQAGTNDFYAILNFDHQYTSNTFEVTVNGTGYGTFHYGDLPITLFGLEGDCITNYIVTIHDSDFSNCSESVIIPAQCCTIPDTCIIEIINLFGIICSDGDIATITFGLDHDDTGTGFIVTDDYGNTSTYTYSQLPVTITILAPLNDQIIGFQVCDIDSPNCCDFIEFANPCYVLPACELTNMTVVSTCTEGGDETFDVMVDIDYLNTSDSFQLSINGSAGITYGYTQLPLTIANLAADCETNYQFVITDHQNNDCNQYVDLGPVCCVPEPCVISIDSINSTACVGGDSVTFTLNITNSGTDTVGFTVFDYLGNLTFYTYDQPPVLLTIEAPVNVNTISFIVCDFGSPGCCQVYNMINPCYTEPVCEVDIVDVTGIACTDGDISSVTFDLDYVAVGSTGFVVTDDYGNSTSYTYVQLPVSPTITAPTFEQLVGFQVCDIDNPNCCDYYEFANPCYVAPPPTGNRVITAKLEIMLTEKTFAFDIDVVHTLEDDCTFDISVNGQKMRTMHKLDNSALLGPFECNSADSFAIAFFSHCINEMVWDTVISHESILCETTSSTENQLQSVELHYDYQSQLIHIANPEGQPLSAQIVDIYGRRIFGEQTDKAFWTTSTQEFIPGVYIMTVVNKVTNHKSSIKLIVTR